MIIKKCNKCGAEIRELPETQTVFPKYYIYKYSSPWLTKEDIDLCQDCVTKFDEWLGYKDDNKEVKKFKEEISRLEAENIHLINQINKHWFRNFINWIMLHNERNIQNE